MALAPGTRLGPYEIGARIGAGGMGEVYRATDLNLVRQIAIKVLPDTFAHDPERLARFEREAKTLASLNHPNIAIIHGFDKTNGLPALVMELVEGETLADRIAQGPIPVDEGLLIAKQIAEALEAAHEQGVIHRDLKPANVKIRPDGTVKVLDFGLAKALDSAATPTGTSHFPTITSPATMTGIGVLLGTAAYMSPEQARGKPVDKRADIWAFGCVLYEMLTGRRAFDGDDATEILGAVVKLEPEWAALPADLPPAVLALLQTCLAKDPHKRRVEAATALFIVDHAASLAARAETSQGPGRAGASVPFRRAAFIAAASCLIVAAIAVAATRWLTRPAPARIVKLAIATTPETALTINGNDRDLAITPDGSRVVYVGNNGTELFVRRLDALEPVSVFTGAPRGPFVSPDGLWVGFFDNIRVLKKVAITGGPPVTIATLDGDPRGAFWTPDDAILFATAGPSTGLEQVSAAGGTTTVLTRPDGAGGEADHAWPEGVPGGRFVLFTILPLSGGLDVAQIAVLDRQTGTRSVVQKGGSHAHYIRSGHLIYAAANTLRAVVFDPATLETRGTPIPVVPDVVTTTSAVGGGVDAAIATDGTLVYVQGVAAFGASRTLVWVDRDGRETPILAPPRAYVHPRISPDGDRVAASSQDQEYDIWLWTRGTLTPFTFGPGVDSYPVWTADGKRLIFISEREGFNLFWQAADGTGAAERLTRSRNAQAATGVSPDGAHLIFTEYSETTGNDVLEVELTGTHTVTALVQYRFAERNGTVSPAGRWLAYEANDSGQFEIYVRPYPDVKSGVWKVSTGGGTRPLWSPKGQELFYMSPAGAIMRVGVDGGTSWAATTPTTIVKAGIATGLSASPGRVYDVSSDGQRFLVLRPASEPNAPPPQLIVVQHFDEELKRLVPTK
jgi:serine/threonine-protein kinase